MIKQATGLSFILSVAASAALITTGVCAQNTPVPKIAFLRPIYDEKFYDDPIYVQLRVSNFALRSVNSQAKNSPGGHINYSLDSFPTIGTDSTQVMMGKSSGSDYLRAGKHLLQAELVDDSNHVLNPRVTAQVVFRTGHPAQAAKSPYGGPPTAGSALEQELDAVQEQLDRVHKQLQQIQGGGSGRTVSE